MKVGQFIKRVVQVANQVSRDREIKWDRSADAVMVIFADGSIAQATPNGALALVDGEMAALLVEALHKEFPVPAPAINDDESEPGMF